MILLQHQAPSLRLFHNSEANCPSLQQGLLWPLWLLWWIRQARSPPSKYALNQNKKPSFAQISSRTLTRSTSGGQSVIRRYWAGNNLIKFDRQHLGQHVDHHHRHLHQHHCQHVDGSGRRAVDKCSAPTIPFHIRFRPVIMVSKYPPQCHCIF